MGIHHHRSSRQTPMQVWHHAHGRIKALDRLHHHQTTLPPSMSLLRITSVKIDRDVDLETACFYHVAHPIYGPFWDHCLEYWKESMHHKLAPGTRFFFSRTTEDMISEPVREACPKTGTISWRPAQHQGRRRWADGVPEEVVRLCGFNTRARTPCKSS